MSRNAKIKTYTGPAGGWGALEAVEKHLCRQKVFFSGNRTLLSINQPDGFDCPGCAWPDPKHTSSFEFCENGAKAVAWEATHKRATPAFFAAQRSPNSGRWSDHELEDQGRLTHPWSTIAATDHYVADRLGRGVRAHRRRPCARCPTPTWPSSTPPAAPPTRRPSCSSFSPAHYGTNNFPDCSNMCHEADQRRPAEIDRHRQRHGDAGGFRPRRCDLQHRP